MNIMNIIQINPNHYYPCSPKRTSSGFTSLMYLVNNTREHPGYLEQIKYILDNNPEELDKKNNSGWTALMISCRNSNTTSTLDTVKLLLEYNPDINASRDDDGENILSISVSYSNTDSSYETVKLLLDHGADITKIIYDRKTVLHKKYIHDLQTCNINAVKLLIDRAPRYIFNFYDNLQDSPITNALRYTDDYNSNLNYELIKYFLDNTPVDFDDEIFCFRIKTYMNFIPDNILNLLHDYQDDVLQVKCALD